MLYLESYTSNLEYSFVKADETEEGGGRKGTTLVPPGPPKHPSFASYNTPLGERIRLITFRNQQFVDWQSEEKLLVQIFALLNQLSAGVRTELWDDMWYFVTTQKGRQTVMVWQNIDRLTIGYVLWSAEPKRWDIRTNCLELGGSVGPHPNGGGITTPDGTVRYKFKFPHGLTGGAKLEIDIENPPNQSNDCGNTTKWNPCDMLLSWGL